MSLSITIKCDEKASGSLLRNLSTKNVVGIQAFDDGHKVRVKLQPITDRHGPRPKTEPAQLLRV
jgi:hypothetical protein